MCVAGGQRTQRHHALRDLVCVPGPNVVALGQNEKGQACCCLNPPHDISNSDRRPADVYTFRLLPGLPLHETLL